MIHKVLQERLELDDKMCFLTRMEGKVVEKETLLFQVIVAAKIIFGKHWKLKGNPRVRECGLKFVMNKPTWNTWVHQGSYILNMFNKNGDCVRHFGIQNKIRRLRNPFSVLYMISRSHQSIVGLLFVILQATRTFGQQQNFKIVLGEKVGGLVQSQKSVVGLGKTLV